MSAPDRRAGLDVKHKKLSVRRQCALLGLARSGVYRALAPAGADDTVAMRRIDALYTDHPFYGSRRIAFTLELNRKRVQRLMRLMGT
jgi:putative transposase